MVPEPVAQPEYIGLASPAEKGDMQLTLYLYSIKERGDYRQNLMLQRGENTMQFPPLQLELRYLLTAASTAEVSSRTIDENRIIGRAMQVLYDNSIIKGAKLLGTLAENNEELRIVIDNIPVDILMRLWNFPNMPYRMTMGYIVGPVALDSTRYRKTKRVKDAEVDIVG